MFKAAILFKIHKGLSHFKIKGIRCKCFGFDAPLFFSTHASKDNDFLNFIFFKNWKIITIFISSDFNHRLIVICLNFLKWRQIIIIAETLIVIINAEAELDHAVDAATEGVGLLQGEARGEHHTPETHLIPLVLQVAAGNRQHITIFGDDYDTPDGTCIRDYIHVVDLAEAHILALQALEQGNRVYNLGNGEGFSVRQVIETARAVTGAAIPEQVGVRRAGDPARLVASSDRIRKELGWAPQFPELEQIIDSAWRWHQRHPEGYPD